MGEGLINERFAVFRERADLVLAELSPLVQAFHPAQREVVDGLSRQVRAPFSFVVMGKVKAGKSRFVNALLQSRVCRVDAAPCTDTIQIIEYGPDKQEHRLDAVTRRIALPVDILKTIAVVDTPGTDTVVEAHQRVTERFIPQSDVVFFVFLAKNPYSSSDWELIRAIRKEWRRNIVFVLQQSDVVSREDLATHVQYIENLAFQEGISPCLVFPVSAKREEEGAPDSGFEEIRRYIAASVTGGRHYADKLKNVLQAARAVLDETASILAREKNKLLENERFRESVQAKIASARERSRHEGRVLAERLGGRYRQIGEDVKREFRDGLTVGTVLRRSFAGIFRRQESLDAWQAALRERFDRKIREDMQSTAEEGGRYLYEGMKWFLQNLREEFRRWRSLPDAGGGQGPEVEEAVGEAVSRIEKRLDQMLSESRLEAAPLRSLEGMVNSIQTSGLLGSLGAALMFLTNVHWIDITGGALTAIGALLATFTLLVNRRMVVARFGKAIDDGRAQYEPDVQEKIAYVVDSTYDHIGRLFAPLFLLFDQRRQRVAPAAEALASLAEKIDRLFNDIDRLG